MARVFNPPPGWPKPEEGWTPPPGWKPDPSWPEPPKGWDFWAEKADDVGSSLFGGSTLSSGSSLFESSDNPSNSYGHVSPSGGAAIPGAPEGPDFTASSAGSNEPASPSAQAQQSSPQSTPTSPAQSSQSSDPYAQSPTQGPGGTAATVNTADAGADPTPQRGASPWVALGGLVLIGIGVGATVYSYVNAAPGETYRIVWLPILFGLILLVQGILRGLRNAASKRQGRANLAPGQSSYGGVPGYSGGESSTVSVQNPTDPQNRRLKGGL